LRHRGQQRRRQGRRRRRQRVAPSAGAGARAVRRAHAARRGAAAAAAGGLSRRGGGRPWAGRARGVQRRAAGQGDPRSTRISKSVWSDAAGARVAADGRNGRATRVHRITQGPSQRWRGYKWGGRVYGRQLARWPPTGGTGGAHEQLERCAHALGSACVPFTLPHAIVSARPRQPAPCGRLRHSPGGVSPCARTRNLQLRRLAASCRAGDRPPGPREPPPRFISCTPARNAGRVPPRAPRCAPRRPACGDDDCRKHGGAAGGAHRRAWRRAKLCHVQRARVRGTVAGPGQRWWSSPWPVAGAHTGW
jgi:hypothetical protein